MRNIKRRWLPVIVAGAIGFGAAAVRADAPATQPSAQELQTQIQQLKSQMATLQANQQQQSVADESIAVQQVMSEADQHSKLLDAGSGITAGWDDANWRFWIGSDDGNFLLHPGGWVQFRYIASYKTQPHNNQDGFELRRLKFYLDGNLWSKDLTYKIQLQNTNGPSTTVPGGTMNVEYGWGQYVFAHGVGDHGDLGVRAGEFKNPAYHEEEAISDNSLLMVERSMADNLVGGNALGGPYIQGVDLMYTGKDNPLHAQVLFTDGDNSTNTDFTNVTSAPVPLVGVPAVQTQDKFGAAARVDYKVKGDWTDNTDFTGKNSGKHDFFALGAGVDFSQGNTTTTTVNTLTVGPPPSVTTASTVMGNNTLRWDADATYMISQKWILYGEVLGFYQQYRGTFATVGHRLDGGGLVQGGYLIDPAWELTARYSIADEDHNFKTGGKDLFSEAGVGVNYFLGHDGAAGNHAKIAADVNYLPTGTPAITGLGYQAQAGSRAEFVGRLMFQIWL